MTRTITIAALTTLAVALPGVAAADPIDASAQLEAHAVVDSGKALTIARTNVDKAKQLVQRSADQLMLAYTLTVARGQSATGDGLAASAHFSHSAQVQSRRLTKLIDRTRGGLRITAVAALAQTGELEAGLADLVAQDIRQQEGGASEAQAQGIGTVGTGNATITATLAVAAYGSNIKPDLRRALERAGAEVRTAHRNLIAAVAELRTRSEGQGQQAMEQTQTSLSKDDCQMSRAMPSSWTANADAAAQNGVVTAGDKSVATPTTPASADASVSGKATVTAEGSGC